MATKMKALGAKRAGERGVFYWSRTGMINCAEHMPYPGSDTWLNDGWESMSQCDLEDWEAQVGAPARCEVCR